MRWTETETDNDTQRETENEIDTESDSQTWTEKTWRDRDKERDRDTKTAERGKQREMTDRCSTINKKPETDIGVQPEGQKSKAVSCFCLYC